MEVLDGHVYMKGSDKCWCEEMFSQQSHWECSDCEIQDYLKT